MHSEKHRALGHITHFYILPAIDAWLDAHQAASAVVIEAPLLFESGLDKRCDGIILITAEPHRKNRTPCRA